MNRFKERSQETEWMDDWSVSGSELNNTLDQIASINQYLGGNQITVDGVKQLLKNTDQKTPIRMIDLGCGNGDLLRVLANLGKQLNVDFELIGIDANPATIQHAQMLSQSYPQIRYQTLDFFSKEFEEMEYDIALATLVLHHLTENEIHTFLTTIVNRARLGVVVNDLQRSALSYYLFKFISLFIKSKKAKQDGLISILRGFKREELERLSQHFKFNHRIKWKWAFRYQWIIKK